ncbi:MAG: hypothetical protein KGJ13_13135, partial [Patescibacteria group bacterium]|nr:hypothetical protein [Patescibacteria group bacterium]
MQIPNEKLKELLVSEGLTTPQVFDEVVAEAVRMGQEPADLLISRGILTKEYFAEVLATYFGVKRASLSPQNV